MVMGNIGIWQLVIIAVIVILLFGTKKLRNIGNDLGSAVKGFKKSVADDNTEKSATEALSDNNDIENNVNTKNRSTSKDEV